MNLFILDNNIELSAKYHCDKHIVKMPTETAQMLSFAYHNKDIWDCSFPDFIMRFSKTHNLHPCSIWMRKSLSNFLYAANFGLALYNEYQYRYNKIDKHTRARTIFEFALKNPPNIADIGLTKFESCMDEQFKISDNPIVNYHNYYNLDKKHLHCWKNREIPHFINIC